MAEKRVRRRKKKIPQVSESITISKLSHEGRGVGEVDGKTVLLHNALPGERVLCEIHEARRGILGGKAVVIQEPSSERCAPVCDFFNACGGCSLQHFSTEAQLTFKEKTLREHFKHFGGIDLDRSDSGVTFEQSLVGPTQGYRYKARLAVRHVAKKGGVLVGFREKYSHYVTDISYCPILFPRVGTLISKLKALLTELSACAKIPQIEVAVGEPQGLDVEESHVALVFRHLEPLSDADQVALRSFGSEENIQIYLQPKGPDTVYRIWPEVGNQRLTYQLPDFGLTMAFHPLDFTQINPAINRRMVSQAIDWLNPSSNDVILDLFCGLGNFTLALARRAAKVVGVEGSAEMVKRAYENAELNSITNCEFFAADLFDQSFSEEQPGSNLYPWLNKGYNKALIDPPRSGAAALLPWLPRLGIDSIVYVSCNPATLARDAGTLNSLGYRLVKVGLMDMFPHTSHVEAMAYFQKK